MAEILGKLTAEVVEEVDVEAVVVVGLEVEKAAVEVATATVGTLGEIVVGEEEVIIVTIGTIVEGTDGAAIADLIKMVGEEATAAHQGPSKVMNGSVILAMNN